MAEAALAHPRLAHHRDAAPLTRAGVLQGLLEHRHLPLAADEAREPPRPSELEAAVDSTRGLQLVDADRLRDPLHPGRAEVAQPEVALYEPGRVFRQRDPPALRQRLHAAGQIPYHATLCGVVHAQVVADLPTTTSPELRPRRTEKLRPSSTRSRSVKRRSASRSWRAA